MTASPRTLPHDWYPAPLPPNVDIGEGSWLYSSFAFRHFASRRPRALTIGRASGLYDSCWFVMGDDAEVTIGDGCTLVGAIIDTHGSVVIGNHCFIAHEVVIADGPFATPPSARAPCGGGRGGARPRIELGDDVWIGAGAILLDGARIGDGAIVGAAAVVDFEVPPCGIVAGNPARQVGHTDRRPG